MLDEQETKIVRELIKNPRASDNQIGKNTGVPIMTVNRKRKKLEEQGLLSYFTYLDTSRYGTKALPARQLYVIKFKIGITKKQFMDVVLSSPEARTEFTTHIFESFLGEKDGQLMWSAILEGGEGREIVEFFNGRLVPFFEKHFGEDCIIENFAYRLTSHIRLLHNYMPTENMRNGMIKKDWVDENIYVE